MNVKSHVVGFSLGYFVCMLIIYLVTDYFSWGFALGSLAGIALLGLLMISLLFLIRDQPINFPLFLSASLQLVLH